MRPRGATDGKTPLRERLDHLIEDMIVGGIRFPDAKREFEKRFLAQVMEIEKGNLSRAAKVLHIHRNTLSKKLQAHAETAARLTVEALAGDLARLCLEDPNIQSVTVRVEKPGAVRFATSVGVEIQRGRDE